MRHLSQSPERPASSRAVLARHTAVLSRGLAEGPQHTALSRPRHDTSLCRDAGKDARRHECSLPRDEALLCRCLREKAL